MKDVYSRVTLDVIGIFALGMELRNLETPSEFVRCYQIAFDPPRSGQILAAINMVIPIRWIPFPRANRDFVKANATMRRLLSDITQQRIDEIRAGKKESLVQKYDAPNKDLLTYMVEEKYLAAKDNWSKEDLVEQVMNFVATGMLCSQHFLLLFIQQGVLTMYRPRDNSKCTHMGHLRLGREPPHHTPSPRGGSGAPQAQPRSVLHRHREPVLPEQLCPGVSANLLSR